MHPDDIAKLINENYQELQDQDEYFDFLKIVNLPTDQLRQFINTRNELTTDIQCAILLNHNLTVNDYDLIEPMLDSDDPEIQDCIASIENRYLLANIAEDENVHPETLKLLAQNNDQLVKYHVASNDNCPIDTLNMLVDDTDHDISTAAFYNIHYRSS